MNDDKEVRVKQEEELERMDAGYGVAMAYFGELASLPTAADVDPGSQLAAHNRNYTEKQQYLNPSYIAWRSIASAGEHAGFAEYMRHITGGGVVDRPQTTLARVTLLGAARAIYVLESDAASERVTRAAKIARTEATDAQRMLDAWAGQTDVPTVLIDDVELQTKDLATSAGAILLKTGLKERTTISESSMLVSVAPQLSDVLADPASRVLTFWNRASGVSHARSWVWSTINGKVNPRFDFLDAWATPVELLVKAWGLWNVRRGLGDPLHMPPDDWEPDRGRYDPSAFDR